MRRDYLDLGAPPATRPKHELRCLITATVARVWLASSPAAAATDGHLDRRDALSRRVGRDRAGRRRLLLAGGGQRRPGSPSTREGRRRNAGAGAAAVARGPARA